MYRIQRRNELAPLEGRGKLKRKSRLWYNSQLLEQGKVTRNRERAFKKYREDHHMRAFITKCHIYHEMLGINKRQYIITKVNEPTNKSRQLFKLVGNLLGKNDKNPMPLSTSSSHLAEEFTEFFHTKIETIREKFKDIGPYQPRQLDVPLLRKFTPVTTSQLEKTIRGMSLKICQLDVIPTDKLKEVL